MSVELSENQVTRRASRAFGWSFGNTAFSRLGTLAIGIALARVLGPEEFGIFAIATVTMLAILSFNELGVSLAVVRWRDDPVTTTPTINTVAVASSAVLTAAVVASASGISTLLGDVRATPVVQVMAVSILINGLVATPAAAMQREFMQKQRTIADQVNTWLGAGLSLLLALLGWGAMSLAVGRLVASVVFGLMLVRWSPVPYRFGWDPEIARRLFRFGLPLAAASIVVFASGYADQIVVGSLLGAPALGIYVLAFNLAAWPVSIFSLPLRAVAPAAFSALKGEPERMSRNFVRVLALLSCVAVPACLAISGAAHPVVAFVYGDAWRAAAEPLLWLAAFAALKVWFELAYDYLVVVGRSSTVLVIQAFSFAASLPAMLLVAEPFGVAGIAGVQFVVGLVLVAPAYLVSLGRIGIPLRAVGQAVAAPAVAGAVTWAGCWGLGRLIGAPFPAAVAAGMFSLLVIAFLCWTRRDEIGRLRAAVRGGGEG